MPVLLHIESSPNGAESASATVAHHLAKKYVEHRPKWTVETVNLWTVRLPDLDALCVAARGALMVPRNESVPAATTTPAWEEVLGIAAHFAKADAVLISMPMWNFGAPYRLKHYIDLVVQPGITFDGKPDSKGHFHGKMTGKPAFAVYSRGGTWLPRIGEALEEHQAPWLRQCLRFLGFTPIREVFVEPTSLSPKMRAHTLAAAFRQAEEAAAL